MEPSIHWQKMTDMSTYIDNHWWCPGLHDLRKKKRVLQYMYMHPYYSSRSSAQLHASVRNRNHESFTKKGRHSALYSILCGSQARALDGAHWSYNLLPSIRRARNICGWQRTRGFQLWVRLLANRIFPDIVSSFQYNMYWNMRNDQRSSLLEQ